MPAILKTFNIPITKRQAGRIRRQFQLACKEHGVESAAMIAQPKTQFAGMGIIALKNPYLNCAVISHELFTILEAVISSQRNAEELAAMRKAKT